MSENEDNKPDLKNETTTEEVQQQPDNGGALAVLQAQLEEEKGKYLRLYAEFENFRRRSAKERLELIASASAEVMKSLLPTLDDFERAIASNQQITDIEAVKKGFELLHQKMAKILEAKGLKAMDSKGQTFDADTHEAIAQVPVGNVKDKGIIIEVAERGYTLNEKIIRHPKVVVGS